MTLRYLLFVLLSLVVPFAGIKASHIMSGDITYQCVSEDTYKVQLTIIGDCRGTWSYPNMMDLYVNARCGSGQLGGNDESFKVYLSKFTDGEEISNYCSDKMPRCHEPFQDELGIHKFVYEGVVDLSNYQNCHEFDMHYELCCRNHAIENATYNGQGLGALNIYLNKSQGCFDSPQFKNDPVAASCDDEPYVFSSVINVPSGTSFEAYEAVPISGYDEVNEEFIEVLDENGGTFHAEYPFPTTANDPFNIDEIGIVSFTSPVEQTVIASKVVEQKYNGEVIAKVGRDFQFIVKDCEAGSLPEFNPDGSVIEICPYEPYFMGIDVTAQDGSIKMGNNYMPLIGHNSILTNTENNDEKVINFGWTPRKEHEGNTYTVVYEAINDACPLVTRNYGIFEIKVKQEEECLIEEPISCKNCLSSFSPEPGKEYIVSGWAKIEDFSNNPEILDYSDPYIEVEYFGIGANLIDSEKFFPEGKIIDGWQRIFGRTQIPPDAIEMMKYLGTEDKVAYFDDIRFHPADANMNSYVYHPIFHRLMATLDENNYATFYEYDNEGNLIRVKRETERGIITVREERQALPIE